MVKENPLRKTLVKVGASIAALALGMASLTGCSSSEDSSKPTKITMLVLGDKPSNGHLEAMLKQLNARLTQQANATLEIGRASCRERVSI